MLQADCCKLLLETVPIPAKACIWKAKALFNERICTSSQQQCCQSSCCRRGILCPAAVAAPTAAAALPLAPAQACSSSCNYLSTAAAPLGEEVAQAKHGGGGKVWGINPCSSAQLAFMLSSRPAGQQDYMELNSESAGKSPVTV